MGGNVDRREHPRHEFEFLVLEHRPEGDPHPQGSRLLHCENFSIGGMRLRGQPRFERFKVTLHGPQDSACVDAEVEVVYRGEGFFGVRYVNPSSELLRKLAWWKAPEEPDRSAGIGA